MPFELLLQKELECSESMHSSTLIHVDVNGKTYQTKHLNSKVVFVSYAHKVHCKNERQKLWQILGDLRMTKVVSTIVFHIVGLGCLIGATSFFLWVHLSIALNGYFPRAVEPNPFIIWSEVTVSAIGLVYVAYLFVNYILLLKMIPKEVREELKLG